MNKKNAIYLEIANENLCTNHCSERSDMVMNPLSQGTCGKGFSWWRHQMDTFPRYWPFVREFTGHRWLLPQRPGTRSFGVFFDLRLNKQLSKQSWGWWFETPSGSLWRHYNVLESAFSYRPHHICTATCLRLACDQETAVTNQETYYVIKTQFLTRYVLSKSLLTFYCNSTFYDVLKSPTRKS